MNKHKGHGDTLVLMSNVLIIADEQRFYFFYFLSNTQHESRLIGRITKQWHPIKTIYNINDEHGNTIYKILGPAVYLPCMSTKRRYSIINQSGNGVGSISKYNELELIFPRESSVKMKATFLAGALLFVSKS